MLIIYRVFADGVTQDTRTERAPFVGIGPYTLVEATSAEEAVRLAAPACRHLNVDLGMYATTCRDCGHVDSIFGDRE